MRLYNSHTKKIEELRTLTKNELKLYVCGITPYDTTHLGHAFLYVIFDVLIRYLRAKHIKVLYTQNVTDIDDDILKKAHQEEKNWKDLGEFWTKRFLSNLKSLNVEMPTYYIKATEVMDKIVEMIGILIQKNHAYVVNGSVYFDTASYPSYGELSHYNHAQMMLISKERGADPSDPQKKHPLDFVLWQKVDPTDDENNPYWESPFGKGRPGWHIECSAMIHNTLGEQIDIHGGGRDLLYPHHESERAQSESITQKIPCVGIWMHAAMLMYEGEKMSKSLGNLVMVSDLLKKYSANAIRLTLLLHHYRTPWEFREEEVEIAEETLLVFKDVLSLKSMNREKTTGNYLKPFEECLNDDLSIPHAIEYLIQLSTKISKEKNATKLHSMQQALHQGLLILGIEL